MKTTRLKLLKSLIEIPSPSGFEDKIAEYIKKELLTVLPKKQIKIDFHNNVTVTIKGTSNKTIILDSHIDEIGYTITNVDKDGLISLSNIGGVDTSILSAKDLIILTNKGKINAVVDRKHSHLVEDEEEENIDQIEYAQVDIGIRTRKAVLRKVKIGDPVVYKSSFNLLSNDKNQGQFISGRGFDDKVGCLVLIETIKEIIKAKVKPLYNLVFVFAWGEEIGYKGSIECVNRYKPDLFVEVDVAFASDYLDDDLEKLVGRCQLGKGVVIMRGAGLDAKGVELLENIARKNQIKFQSQTTNTDCQYTSEHISEKNGGIRALTLGIGVRNMHCPVEIINMKDIGYGINLLTRFVLSQELRKILEK